MEDTKEEAQATQRDETVAPTKQIVGDREGEERRRRREEESALEYERSRLEAVNKYRAEALQKRMDMIASAREKEKQAAGDTAN